MKHGIRVRRLRLRIDLLIVGIHRNPGRSFRESCVRAVIPLHGRPRVVTALENQAWPEGFVGKFPLGAPLPVSVDALDIPELIGRREGIVRHAKLLPLINVRGSLHHVQAGRQHLCGKLPERWPVVPETGDRAGLVVIIPKQAVPSFPVQLCLPAGQNFL